MLLLLYCWGFLSLTADEFALSGHTCLAALLLSEEVDYDPTLVEATVKAHVVWTVL